MRWTRLTTGLMLAFAWLPACAADKVRVGVLNSGGDLGVFIARDKGYFRDENIDIDPVTFLSAAQMIAAASLPPVFTTQPTARSTFASSAIAVRRRRTSVIRCSPYARITSTPAVIKASPISRA